MCWANVLTAALPARVVASVLRLTSAKPEADAFITKSLSPPAFLSSAAKEKLARQNPAPNSAATANTLIRFITTYLSFWISLPSAISRSIALYELVANKRSAQPSDEPFYGSGQGPFDRLASGMPKLAPSRTPTRMARNHAEMT